MLRGGRREPEQSTEDRRPCMSDPPRAHAAKSTKLCEGASSKAHEARQVVVSRAESLVPRVTIPVSEEVVRGRRIKVSPKDHERWVAKRLVDRQPQERERLPTSSSYPCVDEGREGRARRVSQPPVCGGGSRRRNVLAVAPLPFRDSPPAEGVKGARQP
jgi:hypothetical protein